MNFRIRSALLTAALLVPAAAHADYPFILPSDTSLSGESATVTFDAAGSDHVFFLDHRPIQLASIAVTKPDGTAATPTNTVQGRFRSVFDLRLDQQGTWKVASSQTLVMGTLKLDGVERRVGGFRGGPPGAPGGQATPGGFAGGDRRPDGDRGPGGPGGPEGEHRLPPIALDQIPATATDVHLTETVRATETFVTLGATSEDVFKPTGKGLEFVPITHPNALQAGETAKFRFLIDGKPAPGLKVTVVPGGDRYRNDPNEIDVKTGPDGVVAVKWPTAGMYWLGADAEDRNPTDKRAETRRMSTAVTLEIATP